MPDLSRTSEMAVLATERAGGNRVAAMDRIAHQRGGGHAPAPGHQRCCGNDPLSGGWRSPGELGPVSCGVNVLQRSLRDRPGRDQGQAADCCAAGACWAAESVLILADVLVQAGFSAGTAGMAESRGDVTPGVVGADGVDSFLVWATPAHGPPF